MTLSCAVMVTVWDFMSFCVPDERRAAAEDPGAAGQTLKGAVCSHATDIQHSI